MSDHVQESIDVCTINWKEDEASREGTQALREVQSLHDAQANPSLQPMVQALMRSNNLLPSTSHVDAPSHMVEPSHKGGQSPKDSEKEEHSSEVAPQRRQIPCSPNRASKCSHCPSPSPESFLNEERSERGRHSQKRRRSLSLPTTSPLSSDTQESSSSSLGFSYKVHPTRKCKRSYKVWKQARKLETFKEGVKSITFLSYDGSYGQTDKVLAFVQQFDAAFDGEHFTERSKLRHVAMHFQKSARQWWASLKTRGIAPCTWKECRQEIMKQCVTYQTRDDVLTQW